MIEEMVQALVDPRYLVLKELSRWKCAGREELLFPNTGEIIIFIGYFKLGFKVPLHWFMQDLLQYYEAQVHNLNPNRVLFLSTFISFCEDFVGMEPHWAFFHKCFSVHPQVLNSLY